MYHFGVVKCLAEQQCLPGVISGASIGALVAALLAIYKDHELPSLWADPVDLSSFEALPAKGSARRKVPQPFIL